MQDRAVSLVLSQIIHVRHGTPSHKLERAGLSIWIDLDKIKQASEQSVFFSVNKFNLLSFYEKDYGANHPFRRQPGQPVRRLADSIREELRQHFPDDIYSSVKLLTFPRILGLVFNPISVYRCEVMGSDDVVIIYEVHNTFGDTHSYIARTSSGDEASLHDVQKNLHVSPFFDRSGAYRLTLRCQQDVLRLLIRYSADNRPRLTASLYGRLIPLTTSSVLKSIASQGQLPMRAWMAIHYEALKLWAKGCRYFTRPEPVSSSSSLSHPVTKSSKGRR